MKSTKSTKGSPFQDSLKDCMEVMQSLSAQEEVVGRISALILERLVAGNQLLMCGNGGSASDSAHFASEFACRFNEDRRPYPAIALAGDAGLLTAIGNDYEFNDLFARQVQAFGKKGDVLLAFSTSGKSRNILSAIEEARRRELHTVAFLGKGGGFTAGAAELEIVVDSRVTARVQEAHKFLIHAICEAVEVDIPRE